jgi:ABC-type transport system substrate-binding protein
MGLKDGQGQLDTSESLAHTIRVSDDDLIYTIRLREGVTFADGKLVNSEAALFTFDRLMATEAGKTLFPHLRGFNIIGDFTFSLVLERPWPPFMASLALPQASLISPGLGDKTADFLQDHSLGSGRFMVESLTKEAATLVLKPDLPSRPKLDRVEFYYASDPNDRLALFTQKEAHLLVEPPYEGLPSDRVLIDAPTWETRFLAFNVNNPYLATLGAREALSALVRAAYAGAKFKPRGPFPLGLFTGPLEPSDLGENRAREIIAALGPPKVPLTLVYPSDTAWARADAEKIAAALYDKGIPVNLTPLIGQAGRAIMETGAYDLYLGSRAPVIPSPEMWLGQFLEAKGAGSGNLANFRSSGAEEIIQGFRASLPKDQRERKVGDLAALAEKEAPYAFLYQAGVRFLADRRLAAQKTHPMWPEVWPILSVNLNPLKPAKPVKVEPKEEVREFNELVAEPYE